MIDYSHVQEIRKSLEDVWQTAHANWLDTEKFIDQKHEIRVVKPARPRKLGTAASKLFGQVDSLVTLKPTPKVWPLSDKDADKELADRQEKWAKHFLYAASAKQSLLPPFRAAGFNLSAYGYAVGVVRWDAEQWELYQKNKQAFPFQVEFPHPGRILVPPYERTISLAIEIATMPAWEVARRYDVKTDIHDMYAPLEVVMYCDRESRVCWVEGKEVYASDNPRQVVPYVHAYGGKGYEHAPVFGTGVSYSFGPKPEDLAVGALDRAKDSIRAMDELNTALIHMGLTAAYLRKLAKGADVAFLAEQFAQAGMGAIIDITNTESFDWENPPQITPALFDLMADAKADVDQSTFSGVVQGQRAPGVDTATQHALMLSSARIGFGIPMQSLNEMAGVILQMASEMMVEYEVDITLNGVTVKAAEFGRGWNVEVDFLSKDEGELQRERQVGMEEVSRGLSSRSRYFESVGVANAAEEEDEILLDKLEQSDTVQQAIIQAATGLFQQKTGKSTSQPAPETPSFLGSPEPGETGVSAQDMNAVVPFRP